THAIVLAHNLLKRIHPILIDVSSNLKSYNKEEIREIEIDIAKVQAFVNTEVPQKIVNIIKELQSIKAPTDIIHGLNKKLETEFGSILSLLGNSKATKTQSNIILNKVNATTKN